MPICASSLYLPERWLDLEFDHDRVHPRYLTARSDLWVQELLDRLESATGKERATVEELLLCPPNLGESWSAWRGLAHLMVGLQGFEVQACRPPQAMRQVLFERAAAAPAGTSRGEILAPIARELCITPEELERDLYGDMPPRRVLKPMPAPHSTAQVRERYNLALAQGLLVRAESLTVRVEGYCKSVLRYARLQRLLCQARRLAPDIVELTLSGPLSLFHHTLKYGKAMAAWLPVVLRAPRWAICATVMLRDRRFNWQARQGDPIGTSDTPLRRFDSALEEQFFKQMRKQAPQWQILREADPVQIGTRIVTPDFILVHEPRNIRIPVEIVGFWTPQYLESKQRLMQALPRAERWLFCVDESLAAHLNGPFPQAPMFKFKGRIDIDQFLPYLEQWIAQHRARGDRSTCIERPQQAA